MGLALLIVIVIILIVCAKNNHQNESKIVKEVASSVSQAAANEGAVPADNKLTTDKLAMSTFESNVNIATATESNTWSEDIQNMALDPGVKKSHTRFVEDRLKVSNGASQLSERDDRYDVNNWVGLRPPNYKNVKVGKDARTVPSMNYEEDGLLADSKEIRWR